MFPRPAKTKVKKTNNIELNLELEFELEVIYSRDHDMGRACVNHSCLDGSTYRWMYVHL